MILTNIFRIFFNILVETLIIVALIYFGTDLNKFCVIFLNKLIQFKSLNFCKVLHCSLWFFSFQVEKQFVTVSVFHCFLDKFLLFSCLQGWTWYQQQQKCHIVFIFDSCTPFNIFFLSLSFATWISLSPPWPSNMCWISKLKIT